MDAQKATLVGVSPPSELGRRFWLIAALSLGPAVSNSFARFAYALLLPAMRAELELSYSQAGALNTANALGYLAGALIAARYASRVGNRRMFRAGMIVTVTALMGSGLAETFAAQLCLPRSASSSPSAPPYRSTTRRCRQ